MYLHNVGSSVPAQI